MSATVGTPRCQAAGCAATAPQPAWMPPARRSGRGQGRHDVAPVGEAQRSALTQDAVPGTAPPGSAEIPTSAPARRARSPRAETRCTTRSRPGLGEAADRPRSIHDETTRDEERA